MLKSDLGTFTLRMMVVAEMASGGETIPPNKNPNAKVKPGMIVLETMAITNAVTMTIRKAKLLITLLRCQSSFQEVYQRAS